MLGSALRRVDEGEPPLLGLRWVPSEVRLVRAEAEPGHATSQLELEEQLREAHSALRVKDKQIRWLKELAVDEDTEARGQEHEQEVAQIRAVAEWRHNVLRLRLSKLALALRALEAQGAGERARLDQLAREREESVRRLVLEEHRTEHWLGVRSDTRRRAQALRSWLSHARQSHESLARLGLGARARARTAWLRFRSASRAAGRLDARARRRSPHGRSNSGPSNALALARPYVALWRARCLARARLARQAAGWHDAARARGAVASAFSGLVLAALRAVRASEAQAKEEVLRLHALLVDASSASADAQSAAQAQAALVARDLDSWRARVRTRLAAAESLLLGEGGVDAMAAAILSEATPDDGARDVSSVCLTAIDAMRVQLARVRAREQTAAHAQQHAEQAHGEALRQASTLLRQLSAADQCASHTLSDVARTLARQHRERRQEREMQVMRLMTVSGPTALQQQHLHPEQDPPPSPAAELGPQW